MNVSRFTLEKYSLSDLQSAIDVQPRDAIFEKSRNGIIAKVTIKNGTATDRTFKVLTTSPKYYQVKPSSGLVNKSQSVEITFILKCHPSILESRFNDKFQIQLAEKSKFDNSPEPQNFKEVFTLKMILQMKSDISTEESIIETKINFDLNKSAKEEQSIQRKKVITLQKKFEDQQILVEQFKKEISELQNEIDKNKFMQETLYINDIKVNKPNWKVQS